MKKTLDEFKPSLAETSRIVDECKGLTIKGYNDKAGYITVYEAYQKLKKLRVDIRKFGKAERTEAISWQKMVLQQEHKLVAIITPVEDALKAERDKIDQIKIIEERKKLLPSRKKLLETICSYATNDILLEMNEKEFAVYLENEKANYLEEKKLVKEREEEEERRAVELEQAKKEAEEKVREDEQRQAKERMEKMKLEKDAEIKILEEEKIEKEILVKKQAEKEEREKQETIRKDKEEEKRISKNRKYNDFLKKNGYKESNRHEFHIERSGDTFRLYKEIASITIN